MTSLLSYKYIMNNKLLQFIKRNQKRNQQLYKDGLTEGYDYVVCPISGQRVSMIKDNYITQILRMKVEDYPDIQRVCEKRKDNIRKGLKQIDSDSGLTMYELGQRKARSILADTDANGITGYKRKGQQTRATHMNNIDEFGRNGYSQIASKAIIKGNITKSNNGIILDPSVRSEFYRYKSVVTYLTEKHRSLISKGYITGLAGVPGAYHIDHNYSIMNGYKNKVSPLLIGNINNLSMIPWKVNLQKHSASSITLTELFEKTNYTRERSVSEFNFIINIIKEEMVNNIPASGIRILERLYETNLC